MKLMAGEPWRNTGMAINIPILRTNTGIAMTSGTGTGRMGLDLDLVANPDLAMRPDIACFLLVHMAMYGLCTGVGINDYINEEQTDFINARRVINGLDCAELIADYAYEWLSDFPKVG
jgi:hypothetical protein